MTCRYGTRLAFCAELIWKVEVKSLAEELPRFGSVLVEAKVLCNADVMKAVTQYSAFKKKLFNSWCPYGLVYFMTNLGKLCLGLHGWTKTTELRRILNCLLCLLIRSWYSFDFEDEAFGVVEYSKT